MTNDDRMDDMIRDMARSYNEPPAVPREEMWTRIAAATEAPVHRSSRHYPWWLGLAAAMVLGVAIGRLAFGPEASTIMRDTTAAIVADATPPVASTPMPPETLREPADEGSGRILRPDARRAGAVASAEPRPERRTAAAARTPVADPSDIGSLYRHVAYETLGQAEALLTLFRAEENAEARGRVAVWARDVLTSTRLLLDSPAANDVQLAALLRDLELVLAQIAALGAGEDEDGVRSDREMIDDAIRQRDVLPRLRTTLPAGLQPSGAS